MRPVFADSFFFLAAVNQDDGAHAKAIDWSDSYQGKLLTTAWIIVELADALADRRYRRVFAELYPALLSDPRLEIKPASQELLEQGVALYQDRPDKDWSLTDCLSFVVMRNEGLSDALTGDHHFTQAGFNALLR